MNISQGTIRKPIEWQNTGAIVHSQQPRHHVYKARIKIRENYYHDSPAVKELEFKHWNKVIEKM